MANLWDTPILMSVSENLTIFKAVKLPFKTILKVACTTGIQYCASTFKEEKRDYAHWVPGAQIIVIDFDDGLNEFTKSWLKEQFGFLVPTRNYMKEKHGKVCERYRAILLADSPMNVTSGEFVRIYQNLLKDNNLPADTACTDVSRLYYGFGSAETTKYIQVLQGKPLDWKKYNYVDSMEMIGMPSTKKVVDISEYETKVDLSDVPNMNHSKRYECPICALEGLDPNKHHLGFSPEKDLLTCFYDKEGHSPILRALYRKQVLGLDPEIDEDSQEIVEEEVKQPNGKVKKKRVVKPKMEPCLACNGTGRIDCTECSGTGMKEDKLIERKQILNEDGTVKEEQEVVTTKSIPCSHCEGKGFFICPECNGEGKVPKKPKPRVKKPSLPDEMIPLRDRKPKGLYHFNERGTTLDFDAEYAKYVNEVALGFDVETFYPKEVAITEEEAKEQFKDKYISIAATYKRVVKNLKEKALDEIDNQVRLLIIGSAQHQTAFDLTICTEEQIQKLFDLLRTKLMVGHNLKFDIKSIASTYGMDTIPKRVFDTMLGSKILWMMHNTFEPTGTNTYGSVVERYCGVHLPKDQGGSDWGQSELSMEQLVYAVNDVRYLLPVMTKMLQELYKEYSTNYELSPDVDLKQVEPLLGDFLKIHPVMALEMRFVLALARMELHGVMVNESAIRDIVKTHLDEIKEAEEKLGFNPASNPSCLAFVKKIIGPEMESASKEALANYYHIPQIEVLGRAKQAKARAGLLVKMYEHKADGRIHPQFTQILATGRLACKNPNMQQVPRTVKDYIYRAPAGRVVFSADYPAIELRLCSVWHEEPIMIAAFQRGEDLHYKMAKLMTKKPIPHTDEEKHDTSGKFISKEERTAAKNINFGYIYGAWWTTYQKIQLVKNHLKISDADAKESRRVFMSLYKTIAQHIEQMKYEFDHAKPRIIKMKDSRGNEYTTQAPFAKEVSTLFGRRIAADTVNTALNYGIQGSGGDAAKLAICMFEDICTAENIDAFCCNMIHDDIVIESAIKDKERAMNALSRAMNGAANLLMGHHFLTDVTDEITVFAETPLETAS